MVGILAIWVESIHTLYKLFVWIDFHLWRLEWVSSSIFQLLSLVNRIRMSLFRAFFTSLILFTFVYWLEYITNSTVLAHFPSTNTHFGDFIILKVLHCLPNESMLEIKETMRLACLSAANSDYKRLLSIEVVVIEQERIKYLIFKNLWNFIFFILGRLIRLVDLKVITC